VRLFHWFIVRQVMREPVRSAATVLGIALGVAVVIAVRLANASSLAGFEAALDAMSGRTSLEIVGSGFGFDEDRVGELAWLREWGTVSPVIDGDVMTASAEGRPAEMLRVLGVDILRDQPLRDYRLVDARREGAEPADSTRGARLTRQAFLELLVDPRSVILTARFAARHGLRVGDVVPFVIGDREEPFTVRGLLGDAGPAQAAGGNVVLMDIAAAQWALDRLGRIDRLDLRLHEPSRVDDAEQAIAARLPAGLGVQRPARRTQQVEKMLGAFHLNLTALSYIALLVGLFLVYNTVATSVIVRREEVGTLRAIGVSRAHVLRMFVAEALALAVPGCALGIAFGRLLAYGTVSFTQTTVNTLYVASAAAPPALTWGSVALGFGVGLPLSVLAALLPAVEAARVPPIAAIRGADWLATRRSLGWWRLALPCGLFAMAAWLATLDPIDGMPLAGYASALALVFGSAFLVPPVLFLVGRMGRWILGRVFRVESWLANANLAGAIPRLSVSVAALAVALSMMVAIAVMIGSFRETVIHWVGQTLQADLFIGPATRGGGARQATLSPEVGPLIAQHPLVLAVDPFRTASVPYEDGQIYLGGGDFGVLVTHGNLLFMDPADGRRATREAIGRDEVVVSEAFARKHRKALGDAVVLATPAGEQRFRIAAIYYDYSSDRGVVMMDRTTFTRHFGVLQPTGVTVYLRDGADADAVRADLLEALGDTFRVYIHTNRSLRAQVLRVFDSTFAITYALELIAILVAILGVAATLLTLILERRRELAVLRLVGADRRQVRRMVVLEAALMGGVSQAIGLGAGVLLSLVLIFVVNVQSFGWTIQFHLPVAFLAQMSLLILVATALAGLYPARLASRMVVAAEVVEE
jgi:putative ABC transport system permease protein